MLKKYGTSKSSLKDFSKEYGLNARGNKFVSLPYKYNNFFNYYLRNKRVGRSLFDHNKSNVDFLKVLKSHRGLRHKNRYPVRGQRTHTNSTRKNFKFPNI